MSLFAGGCASASGQRTARTSTVLVVNGADGPGPWYHSLISGLEKGRAADRVEAVNWGLPWLVLPNLSFSTFHKRAENRLLDRIEKYRKLSPDGRITLVGHSAGCGVILDALENLAPDQKVDEVLLLAPAVSKEYPLEDALSRVSGTMHVFYSHRDQALLRFSTTLTGTYDHVWSQAAGYRGFVDDENHLRDLPRLQQHPYDPQWKELGHRGGHFGYRASDFARNMLSPLAAGRPLGSDTARQAPTSRSRRGFSPQASLNPATQPLVQ